MIDLRESTWESKVLLRAYEGFDGRIHLESGLSSYDARLRPPVLEQAYRHCENITRSHSRTFFLASGLLQEEKRLAARALYAFCRFSDDLVDREQGSAKHGLEDWRRRSLSGLPTQDDLIALAWHDTRIRYRIPRRYAEQLIEGVSLDIDRHRYQTFEDLAHYCYGVASTVGLMAMHIIGFTDPEAIPYAVKLGVALQLTNILRDIGEDWQNGRLYLPQDELAEFGLGEEDIESGIVDARWRAFMHFQIERNRRLYAEALPGIAYLSRDGKFSIAAAAYLYQAILDDIEAHDMDVFHRRAHVGAWGKLRRLPAIWWRSQAISWERSKVVKRPFSG
jgi:phytoene synthase